VFEAPIVAEQQYDNRRHYRAERDRDQAQREIARRIADESKDIRTEKPAEIAERAMPPAAAVPDSIAVGSDQKHGPVDDCPIAATTSIAIVITGSVIRPQAISPAAPTA
jgi:hypothetical protein